MTRTNGNGKPRTAVEEAREALIRAQSIPPKEYFQQLVDLGFITPDGKVTDKISGSGILPANPSPSK